MENKINRKFYLVSEMVKVGEKVMTESKGDLSGLRMGFHWPPFHSISHLHLHVIAPEEEMGWIARGIFKVNSYWFVHVSFMYFKA